MNSGTEERFADLCAAAALGALDPDEQRELEQLLCRADARMLGIYRDMENAALHLAATAMPLMPPVGAKARIMEAARSGGALPAAGATTRLIHLLGLSRPRLALAITATLALLLAGLAIVTVTLQRTVHRSDVRVSELTGELQQRERLLEILQSKSIEVVLLNGLELNPGGYGKILWDTEKRVALLQVANLPPAPANSTYQLWVFPSEGNPQSAGLIAPSEQGRPALFRLENMPRIATSAIKGWLVTLEPVGGATRPSKAWYLGARAPL